MDHRENSSEKDQIYGEFVSLLSRYDQSIRSFIRSLVPSPEAVDDVIQDTALECWKKFPEFQRSESNMGKDDFIRWACVIARYKALSWHRNRSRDKLVFKENVIDLLADTFLDEQDQHSLEREAIESCLNNLPSDQRRLVLSVHSPGQSIALIAKESGEKARRLYSKVNQIRKQLLDCVHQKMIGEIGNG